MSRVIPIGEFEKLGFKKWRTQPKEKPQESRVKRIAKKLGIGAAGIGAGAGIILLSMRPALRKKVFQAAKNPKGAWEEFKRSQRHSPGGDAWEEFKRRRRRPPGGGPHYARAQQQQSAFREYGLHEVKTKADVRKKWKEMAMKHHPDRGGDLEKMKQINATFDAFKKTPEYEKLAMARYWMALASALVR